MFRGGSLESCKVEIWSGTLPRDYQSWLHIRITWGDCDLLGAQWNPLRDFTKGAKVRICANNFLSLT